MSLDLVAGRRAVPTSLAQLAPAATLAERFAYAYAAAVYLRHPPRLPGATRRVDRDVVVASSRVPEARRGQRAHVADLRLQLAGPERLEAAVELADAHSPPFTVGFTVAKTTRGWRVVAISTPE